MKIIFFNNNRSSRFPFMAPWGTWGCFWRAIVFMFLLTALVLLLSLFRRCNSRELSRNDLPEEILNPPQRPLVPVDSVDTGGYPGRLTDPGDNLPVDSNNVVRPVDPRDIVTPDTTHRRIAGNKLNVILNSDAGDVTFRKFADEFKRQYPDSNYSICYYETKTKLLQIELPMAERDRVKNQLNSKIPSVRFKCFEEEIFESSYTPNDPVFRYRPLSWYYAPIQAYEAWEITKGSPEVTVAIIDSYFDLQHVDLNSDRIVKPYSVRFGNGSVAPVSDCRDEGAFMHGSMVASMAIGTMDNGAGSCGIAPRCKFMPISLGDALTSLNIVQALLYAIYQGADVVNLSLGAEWSEQAKYIPLEEQINLSKQLGLESEDVWNYIAQIADDRGCTIVWAAGNENVFTALDSSKRWKNAIYVSALDLDMKMASFSNYGYLPNRNIFASTVSAPGVNIVGACPWNSYNIGPGTSFSAPIVTGAIALMKSVNSNLSNEQIVKILRETGKPVAGNAPIGPVLQIKNAIVKAQQIQGSQTGSGQNGSNATQRRV